MSEPSETFDSELDRLRALEEEYRITMRVMAVLANYLLGDSPSETLVISDEALINCGSIHAWRDESRRLTYIEVKD